MLTRNSLTEVHN